MNKLALLALLIVPASAAEVVYPCRLASAKIGEIRHASERGVQFVPLGDGDCSITYTLRPGMSISALTMRQSRRLTLLEELKTIMVKFDAGTAVAADRNRAIEIMARYVIDQETE